MIKSTVLLLFLKSFGIIVNYLLILFISNKYNMYVLGEFMLTLTVLQIISSFGRFGLDIFFLKKAAPLYEKRKWKEILDFYIKTVLLLFIINFVLSLILYFNAYNLSVFFKNENLYQVFKYISFLIIPFVLLYLHTEALRAIGKKYHFIFFQQIFVFLFTIVFAIILNDLFTSFYASILFGSIIVFVVFKKYYSKIFDFGFFSFKFDIKEYVSLIKNAYPIFVSTFLSLFLVWTDIIMIGYFLSSKDVGMYSTIMKLASVISLPLVVINSFVVHKFSIYWESGNKEELILLLKRSTLVSSVLSIIIAFLLFLIYPLLFSMFKIETNNITFSVFVVLSAANIINALCGSVGYFLLLTNFQNFHKNVIFSGIVLNILLNYIFIPKIGILGAGIASMVSMVFWNLMFLLKVKKEFDVLIIGGGDIWKRYV